MGSHEKLRNYQMTLDLTKGVPLVKLKRMIKSVVVSEIEIEENIGDYSRSSSMSSQNSELKILMRSQSF
jgi:hypothetical protein